MAYLGSFDANTVEPADFSALPAGVYTTIISSSEFRSTKNGTGQYLMLAFQVVDGPCKGRYLWHNLNLQNQNQKAEEIAQRELSAICRATGKMQITDSEQLHNIPMRITVSYIPAKDTYPEKNQIKKWEPLSGAGAAPAIPAAVRPAVAPQPAPSPATASRVPPAAPPVPPAAPPAVKGKPWGPKAPVAAVAAAEPEMEDIPF